MNTASDGVRYLKDDAGRVTRVEPRPIVFTDLDIVDGRRGQAVRDWIGARPRGWRNRVELVAMDMWAILRLRIHAYLRRPIKAPKGKIRWPPTFKYSALPALQPDTR
ncbi:transposase [Pseudarthrobacter sp. IC2-21]|uniref:transposase n=1 Tax=Pseudarthrobacter sp. IC2-21 TaxID=3092262 RepID=UPI0039BC5E5C